MNLTLEDYSLPLEAFEKIAEVAESAEALLIGEIHGTREIPQIVAGLLPMLYERGYRGLGVEAPQFEQETLRAWLSDPTKRIPDFYAHPWNDGRGSREMLALIQRASQDGFTAFCFDPGFVKRNAPWSERDAGMASYTRDTWQNELRDDKILLICGNNHAFLKPIPNSGNEYWPSFAECLRRELPEKQYRSINLMPASGEFFNMKTRQIRDFHFLSAPEPQPAKPLIVPTEFVSLQVNFPNSHAATFISTPKAPGQWQLLQALINQLLLKLQSVWMRKN